VSTSTLEKKAVEAGRLFSPSRATTKDLPTPAHFSFPASTLYRFPSDTVGFNLSTFHKEFFCRGKKLSKGNYLLIKTLKRT
jgi:hypothetical protein